MRPPLAGINRATGRPFRAMMYSAPASTSRTHRANARFASRRVIVLLMRGRLQRLPAALLNKHPNVIASEAKQSRGRVRSRVEIAALRSQ
jgi:hypothetical protein